MNWKQIFNTISIALCPATGVYVLMQGVGMDQAFALVLILLSFPVIIQKKGDGSILKLFFILVLLSFLSVLNTYSDFTLMVHNLFPLTISFLCLYVISTKKIINIDLFCNTLYVFGILATAICCYQRMEMFLTGFYEVDYFIPGLEINRDIETFTEFRPSAFFTEPAHLAIFLLPIFYLSLKRKFFLIAVITGLGVFMSSSTTGFLILGALLLYYLYNNGIRKWYLYIILLAGVAFASYYLEDMWNENMGKLAQTENNDIRLLGGLIYIAAMNGQELLFGVGLNQLEHFSLFKHIPFMGNYSNAILYSIISYGFAGALAMLSFFIHLWKKTIRDRGFYIILVGIMASDQILFNRNFVYLVTFVLLSEVLIKQEVKQ